MKGVILIVALIGSYWIVYEQGKVSGVSEAMYTTAREYESKQ